MRIAGVMWREQFVDKLLVKHGVYPDEVEDVLFGRSRFRRIARGHTHGEDVYEALGQTASGRHLIVIFLWKAGGEALVISARDMSDTERRRYGNQR